MHLIVSRLKLPGTVFRGKLSLIQRIRAIVSHPSLERSSSGGMGLQTTRPLIASSSHAPTPCALARRIFSIGDNIWSVDNLWIAYRLIWSINIECQSVEAWVIASAFGTPWSYSRLWTISAHSSTPPSPNATQDSHRKLELWLYQKVPRSTGKEKKISVHHEHFHEHTSGTSLSISKQNRPSYILQVQWEDLYPDLHNVSQAQEVKVTCLQRHRTIVRIRIWGHKRACLQPRRIDGNVWAINQLALKSNRDHKPLQKRSPKRTRCYLRPWIWSLQNTMKKKMEGIWGLFQRVNRANLNFELNLTPTISGNDRALALGRLPLNPYLS